MLLPKPTEVKVTMDEVHYTTVIRTTVQLYYKYEVRFIYAKIINYLT